MSAATIMPTRGKSVVVFAAEYLRTEHFWSIHILKTKQQCLWHGKACLKAGTSIPGVGDKPSGHADS